MNPHPTPFKTHPGRPKGSTSLYTVKDLIDAIESVEQQIKEASGKDFNYLQAIVQRSLKSDMLAIALLNRILPIPKEPFTGTLKLDFSSIWSEFTEIRNGSNNRLNAIPDRGNAVTLPNSSN